MARFKQGESGNPAGRPKGVATKQTRLRKQIEGQLPEILEAVFKAAKDGDIQAARLLVDKVLPNLRPVDMPVKLPMGDNLTESGENVLAALSASRVTPEEAGKLVTVLNAQARLIETDELAERVKKLEEAQEERRR